MLRLDEPEELLGPSLLELLLGELLRLDEKKLLKMPFGLVLETPDDTVFLIFEAGCFPTLVPLDLAPLAYSIPTLDAPDLIALAKL